MDEFDFKKRKDELDRTNQMNALANVASTITQGFDEVPTAYEMLYGGKSKPKAPREKFQVDDESTKQAKLYQEFKAHKDVQTQKKQDAEDALLDDPNSNRSKALMAFAKARGIDATNGREVLQLMDPKKVSESEADFSRQMKLKNVDIQATARQKELDRRNELDKARLAQSEKSKPKTLDERLAAMSGTDKARYDNAKMVAGEINKMASALDSGDNTFSMWGDNNYTSAERKAAEAYGRMQSGGAINKDEEERFLAMLPRSKDDAALQRQKLKDQYSEMESRLKTLGFTPEEAGISLADFEYGASPEEAQAIAERKALKSAPQIADVPKFESPMSPEQVNYNKTGAQLELAKRMKERKTKEARR